jgi:hypothetical protein
MKKFIFVVTFIVLSQISLAEDTNASNTHADSTNTSAITTSASEAPQKPVVVDRSAKIFEYLNACLAGRPASSASALPSR